LKDPWEDPSYADETDVSDNPKLIDPTFGKSDYVEICHGLEETGRINGRMETFTRVI